MDPVVSEFHSQCFQHSFSACPSDILEFAVCWDLYKICWELVQSIADDALYTMDVNDVACMDSNM